MSFQVPIDSSNSSETKSYFSLSLSENEIQENIIDMSQEYDLNVMSQDESLNRSLCKKKESKWPEWDGNVESFRSYIFELVVKIEEDRQMLGSDRAVCLGMLGTLPKDKKSRVSNWFESGGPAGNYNWKGFVEHFKYNFEDKRARLTAVKELTQMKQGSRQSFNDFFQQFEFKLAQCGGLHWDSPLKVSHLNNGLNETLEKALIGIDLPPDDDYAQWVSKVRDVAGRLESHQKRNFIKSGNEIYRPAYLTNQNPSIDADGDTIMTGVNALLALLNNNDQSSKGNLSLASLGKNNNFRQNNNGKDTRPRAPWRSQDEFQKLLSLGVCVRCGKAGHYSARCPTFRAAIRQRVNISSSRVEVEEEDSGKDCP